MGIGSPAEPRIRDDGQRFSDQRCQPEILRQAVECGAGNVVRPKQSDEHPGNGAFPAALRPDDEERLLVSGIWRQQKAKRFLEGVSIDSWSSSQIDFRKASHAVGGFALAS